MMWQNAVEGFQKSFFDINIMQDDAWKALGRKQIFFFLGVYSSRIEKGKLHETKDNYHSFGLWINCLRWKSYTCTLTHVNDVIAPSGINT